MPKYLTLVSIHKPLGIAILVLVVIRLAVRLLRGAPPLPADLPEPLKLAAHLSHYLLYALLIAMPLIGWGMLSAAAYPVRLYLGLYLPAIPSAERSAAYDPWGLLLLPRVRVFRANPHAHRRGVLSLAGAQRRRVSDDGLDPRCLLEVTRGESLRRRDRCARVGQPSMHHIALADCRIPGPCFVVAQRSRPLDTERR